MTAIDTAENMLHVGDRVAELAVAHPDQTAAVLIDPRGDEAELTWRQVEWRANATARVLERHGIAEGSVLGVALAPSFDHITAVLGAWKLGATVVPLNPGAGERERRVQKEAIGGRVVGRGDWADIHVDDIAAATDGSSFPGRGTPRSASVSGGSTGLPRIILRDRAWRFPEGGLLSERDSSSGARMNQVQLVFLPLYHAGFTALYHGLVLHHKIILMVRFTPRLFFATIPKHKVQYLRIVPSYMRLALDCPNIEHYDVSSVEAVNHGSAACQATVKRRWIDIFSPERIIEDYSFTERIGIVTIRGDEWLLHPGSVGRPTQCEVKILDDDQQEVRPGQVGLIYMRTPNAQQPEYVGDGSPLIENDGFRSVGDLGYLDNEGYLFLVDRKVNVVNVGGVDVYPAEVAATLLEHPQVADVAVVTRPHQILGRVLHALVQPANPESPSHY